MDTLEAATFTMDGYAGRLFLDSQFGLAKVHYERALAYTCRTYDPAAADLYLVPAYATEMTASFASRCAEPLGALNHYNALFAHLARQAPGALGARGGADHVLVGARIGAHPFETHPLCELDVFDVRFGKAARLSIEEQPVYGDSKDFPYRSSYIWTSVPYPSFVRLEPGRKVGPWHPHHRAVLVAAAFGIKELRVETAAWKLRKSLRASCIASLGKCVVEPLPQDPLGETTTAVSNAAFLSAMQATATLYWNSTFCLSPEGDSVSRKATIDALLLGCIPVLFRRSAQHQWLWHWGGWVENATVLIDSGEVLSNVTDPIALLAAIPRARVRHMQATIAANAHRMQYARPNAVTSDANADSSEKGAAALLVEDAFMITLRALNKRAKDESLRAAGRILQAKGREIDRGFEYFATLNTTTSAHEGFCLGSTSALGKLACDDGARGHAAYPWTGRRDMPNAIQAHFVQSALDCEAHCVRCARCRVVSYSQLMQTCTWHHTMCNSSLLRTTGPLKTFRTWAVAKHAANQMR